MQAEPSWRNMWHYVRGRSLADEQQLDTAHFGNINFLPHTKTCQRALMQLLLTTPANCTVTTYYKAFTVGCTGSLLAFAQPTKVQMGNIVHASFAIQSVAPPDLTALSDHAVMQQSLLLAAPGRLERVAWPQKHASKSNGARRVHSTPRSTTRFMSMRL
jgi:hypothetical protein